MIYLSNAVNKWRQQVTSKKFTLFVTKNAWEQDPFLFWHKNPFQTILDSTFPFTSFHIIQSSWSFKHKLFDDSSKKIKNHCYHSSKQYLLEINEKQINKQTERKNRYQIQNKIRTKMFDLRWAVKAHLLMWLSNTNLLRSIKKWQTLIDIDVMYITDRF